MMHDGDWFGMGGMGLYWQIPVLILVVVMVVWMFARRRSGGDR
jgi:cytochrome c-type biogenesis protein CcmH/NrfF